MTRFTLFAALALLLSGCGDVSFLGGMLMDRSNPQDHAGITHWKGESCGPDVCNKVEIYDGKQFESKSFEMTTPTGTKLKYVTGGETFGSAFKDRGDVLKFFAEKGFEVVPGVIDLFMKRYNVGGTPVPSLAPRLPEEDTAPDPAPTPPE